MKNTAYLLLLSLLLYSCNQAVKKTDNSEKNIYSIQIEKKQNRFYRKTSNF